MKKNIFTKILFSVFCALFFVTAAQAFEFLPYTSVRGSLYLTYSKLQDERISTVVPAFASAVGMHFGEKTRLEFEFNSRAMAGNQIPSQISKTDVYASVKIETYMINIFYNLYKNEKYTLYIGAGGGAANTTFFFPYDDNAEHKGVEGYLCSSYSGIIGIDYRLLKRVNFEIMLIYNTVSAPFDTINNINGIGIVFGLRFDTLID